MILATRYENNPKAIVGNGSEKVMSVKINALKKTSVSKLFKQQEVFFAVLKNCIMINVSLTKTEQSN